jgi:Ca-activated chloride channel family protein
MTYGPGGNCNVSLKLRPAFNAGPKIIAKLKGVSPDGTTPLTSAVAQAANILDYRHKPALIVLLTDGEETCGGSPCALAKDLKATGTAATVQVIGFHMDILSTRAEDTADMKCLAAETGGRFVNTNSIEELVAVLNNVLGCPLITKRIGATTDAAVLP